MRPHRLGLRSRFLLFILIGVSLVSGFMAYVSFVESREAMLVAAQDRLYELTRAQAAKLAQGMAKVSERAAGLAATLEAVPVEKEEVLLTILRQHLSDASHVFGMAIAYEPYRFDPQRRLFAPYMYRSPQGIKTEQLGVESYDYPNREWYLLGTQLGRPVWSEPYFDEGGGGVLMTTYTAPMVKQSRVQGLVTADVSLENLGREVSRLGISQKGWAFVISRMGTFLAAPQPELVMRESIFSLAETLKRPDLRRLGKRMIRQSSGVMRFRDWRSGDYVWLAFAPVEGLEWSFGAVVPESEVLAPAWELARRQGMVALSGLAVLVGVVWLLVAGLIRPLQRLAKAANNLASGDFSTRVQDVRPGDEVGALAQSFNQMVGDLDRYVEELANTTAAKQRIESELDLARQIQQSILPRTYPAYPDRPEFDLYGKTIPAREVGGDFYDYFMVGQDHLGLVVGDVSGKGVPSALFMTVTRTLIKNSAAHNLDPVQVLEEANQQIYPENEMCMFVTVFYGVYQLSTGKLVYANAGHPSPFLRRTGGEVHELPRIGGMAVGINDELGLQRGEVQLEHGDIILIFSDGLDEAINPAEEMFGLKRVNTWLSQAEVAAAPDMLEKLVTIQKEFTESAEQFDDLTLLLFRRQQ
jgi:sigma-B regulation protein RsbU (phosphoserine phosphatase)